jgi:hypothetical protein
MVVKGCGPKKNFWWRRRRREGESRNAIAGRFPSGEDEGGKFLVTPSYSIRPPTRSQQQGKSGQRRSGAMRAHFMLQGDREQDHAPLYATPNSSLRSLHSPVLPSVVPLLHLPPAISCRAATVAFCASVRLLSVVWQVGRGETAFRSDCAH